MAFNAEVGMSKTVVFVTGAAEAGIVENSVPQTLGKTAFDFVTFLAGVRTLVHNAASGKDGLVPDI